MVFLAVASVLLAATFLYVWAHFLRRRYALLWALSWVSSLPHLYFSWLLLSRPSTHGIWFGQQVFVVATAAFMAAGRIEFVGRPLPLRPMAAVAAAFLSWAAVAPALTHSFHRLMLPHSALLAGTYLWAALLFARLHGERRTRAHFGRLTFRPDPYRHYDPVIAFPTMG